MIIIKNKKLTQASNYTEETLSKIEFERKISCTIQNAFAL